MFQTKLLDLSAVPFVLYYFCRMNFCEIHQLKFENYASTWEKQKQIFQTMIDQKRLGEIPMQHIIPVEHPHVYTFGKHAKQNHLLIAKDFLSALGAETFEIERGGDITYHGPGQLVVYPLLDLEQIGIGLKDYVAGIESSIIHVLNHYGIQSGVIKDRVGVWVDIGKPNERKIAAIGIKSSRYVTMHGLALNVNTDLSMFQHIVPCGIPDKGVTSLKMELNEEIPLFEVNQLLTTEMCRIFALRKK